MKYYSLFFFIIIFSSCKKEGTTNHIAYLKNKTNHIIEIRPFYAGLVQTENIIRLLENETKEIANGNDRGIASAEAGFTPKYFAGADSMIVVFDNLYSITHYTNTPLALAPKHYVFTSLRNIGNLKSYTVETKIVN